MTTAYSLGWHQLRNGELLAEAEANGFDLFVTTDQNIRYQQNLSGRKLGILVLLNTDWRLIRQNVSAIVEAVDAMVPGAYAEVAIPNS